MSWIWLCKICQAFTHLSPRFRLQWTKAASSSSRYQTPLKKKPVPSTRDLDYSTPWKSEATPKQSSNGPASRPRQVNALFLRPELGTGRSGSRQRARGENAFHSASVTWCRNQMREHLSRDSCPGGRTSSSHPTRQKLSCQVCTGRMPQWQNPKPCPGLQEPSPGLQDGS